MDGVSYRCNTQMVPVHKSRRYHHRQCRKRPMLLSRLGKFKQKNHAIFFPQIIVWTAIIDRYLGRLSTVNIETVVFFLLFVIRLPCVFMDHLILCLSVCYIIYGNFRLRLIFEIKKILFTSDQKFYLPHLSILLSIFYYHIYIDKSFIMTHDFFIILKKTKSINISVYNHKTNLRKIRSSNSLDCQTNRPNIYHITIFKMHSHALRIRCIH